MNETITGTLINMAQNLGETIKNVAPEVWRIMIKQQYVIGIQLLLGSIGTLIAFIILKKFYDKNKDEWDYDDFGKPFTIMGLVVLFILTIVLIINGVGFLINPEYYAIKDLTNMLIPKPGN